MMPAISRATGVAETSSSHRTVDDGYFDAAGMLITSPRLVIETLEADGSAVVYHADRMTRLRLTRHVLSLLRRCERPTTRAALLEELGGREEVRAAIGFLEERAFLVPEHDLAPAVDEGANALFTTTESTLFRTPRRRESVANVDVAIIGLPSDAGLRSSHGERLAPEVLRVRSYDSEYRLGFGDGLPIGWFDVGRRGRILEGITMCDHGDVRLVPGEPLQRYQERVGAARKEAAARARITLALGGDHSNAYAIVASLPPEIAVVMFDAHTDFDRLFHGAAPTAINVGRAIATLPNVERFIQVGHRGFTLSNKLETLRDDYHVVPADELRRRGASAVTTLVPHGMPFYVSIDANVLDPAIAPAVTTLAPAGLLPSDLRETLEALSSRGNCLGMDICGFNPECEGARLTAKVIVHLILACLDAITAKPDIASR